MVGLMKYYFIATYGDIKKDKLGWLDDGGSCRVVGFYEDFATAEKCILENWGDIYEDGYYKYAVIEALEPGLYPTCLTPTPVFYKWEGTIKEGGFKKIKRPSATKGFCGFTIA